MVLTRADDYPVHQTPEPIACAGTDRNFYDRYFFNGYAPDGSGFFALAFGVYPQLDVADAHFSFVRGDKQYSLHASAEMNRERMTLKVGPISIEIIEPLRQLRVTIDESEGMGIRSIFPSHWFDNAVSGPGLFGPTELALNLFNKLETGHYYRVTQCREPGQGSEQVSGGVFFEGDDPVSQALNEAQALAVPTYPPGPHCNALGLTELGHQMIESLMRRGLLIETDHTSVESKEAIFALAESVGYPLISGHTGTGGITTETQKRRIFALGGLVSPFNNQAPALIEELLALRDLIGPAQFTAAGFASDAGGLASQPAPRSDAADKPLVYPFRVHDGAVRFDRQVTGERVYDLNTDGVAHYGLYPDLLADMAQHPGGEQALEILFGAAEAYLRMWERAEATAADLRGAEAN